jgi:hypothetical protein
MKKIIGPTVCEEEKKNAVKKGKKIDDFSLKKGNRVARSIS